MEFSRRGCHVESFRFVLIKHLYGAEITFFFLGDPEGVLKETEWKFNGK